MILAAFYAAATEPQPMNLTQVVAYVWLGQALLGMLPWNVDADLRGQVRDGTVAYDLLRPLDLYAYWFGRTPTGLDAHWPSGSRCRRSGAYRWCCSP